MAASWFEKGRPALFEALSNVCDQIGRDLAAEAQARSLEKSRIETSGAAEEGRAEKSDIVSRLEAENEELRRQLAKLRPPVPTLGSTPASLTTKLLDQALETTRSSTDDRTGVNKASTCTSSGTPPCRDCSRILRRYHALSANFKTAKDALQRRKDERNRWIKHSEHLMEQIQAAENQYSIQILDQKAQPMEIPTSTALEADEQIPNPSLSFMSQGGPEEAEPQLPELTSTPRPTGEALEGPYANSETTQGEASDDISQPLPVLAALSESEKAVMKEEQSSDTLEIISEREVRKRKRNEVNPVTAVVPKIKTEIAGSSSPVMLISPVQHTQESIDLGDIVKKIQTPRKRQLLQQVGPQSEITPRSKFTTFTPVHPEAQKQPQTTTAPRQSSALMPLCVNARTTRPAPVKIQRKDRWAELNMTIESLAEEGASYGTQPFIEQVKSPSVCSTKSRLDALLNDPPAQPEDEKIIGSRLSKRPVLEASAHNADLNIPGRRQLPFDKDGPVSSKSTPAKRPLSLKPVSEAKTQGGNSAPPRQATNREDSRSLRHRPLSKLCLEDFKVNPRANEGHDFAFTEVVRDRGDRACLPGCTDMHCCGKEFRAFAISQRPSPPLTSAQRQEEQKLLEEYLGDFSYRLASMDKHERMEVWIEAKTQELANKYGKHRHKFSRMQSPPGFWDANFPDTQQLEADREEAAKRMRRAVAERYREATRPGGRWIFKDE
ncbi:DNA repair protein Sae2/CtIP [Metarhizium album ARSEF 1941]|uniref:DNA repair protein Sae2/CtIP n=1 Tax=Metarhizium album (strain ARSEF 1941) TaxID=1081103 RepID=A0A0B2WSV0_METAS|nr:DNA repair protein Sae2/CtIP [Metarhizium album ARSEF 1941]KHN96567.1 DNA repair protein Sae2/CtIP [Metarhizium album ARSEF 1941]